MISAGDIDLLRSIARAGGEYARIKRLLDATGWKIDEDDTDFGFPRVFIPDAADERYRLIIGYNDPDRPPYLFLTVSLFHDSQENLDAFLSAFRSAAKAVTRHLGVPTASGEHRFPFRTWPYAYQRWSLPEGEFTLVQEEFDIQDGMEGFNLLARR